MSRIISADKAGKGQPWLTSRTKPAASGSDFVPASFTSSRADINALAIREAAQQEGFREGYEEGQQAARGEIAALQARLEASLEFIANPVGQLDQQIERELVELALAVARQILRREIKTDPKHLVGLIREAVKQLPSNSQKITIHLWPDDAQILRELLHESDKEQHWQIIDDPALKQGDCTIHTDSSFIDASVDALISRLAVDMLGGHRNGDPTGATPQAGSQRRGSKPTLSADTEDDGIRRP